MNILSERLSQCITALCALEKVQSFRHFAAAIDYLPENLSEILQSNIELSHDVVKRPASYLMLILLSLSLEMVLCLMSKTFVLTFVSLLL